MPARQQIPSRTIVLFNRAVRTHIKLLISLNTQAKCYTQSPSVPSTMRCTMSVIWTLFPATRIISLARLNDLNERIPEAGRVLLSETYIRSKLIRAACQFKGFKAVIDHIIMQPVETWFKIKVDELVKQLELAKANDASLQSKRHSPSHVCFSSQEQKPGKCSKARCQYSHSSEASSQTEAKRATQSPGATSQSSGAATETPPKQYPDQCFKCGEQHPRKICKFSGKSSWCQKQGHKEAACKQRVVCKPKLMMSVVGGEDGVEARAKLFTVEDTAAQADSCLSLKASHLSPVPQATWWSRNSWLILALTGLSIQTLGRHLLIMVSLWTLAQPLGASLSRAREYEKCNFSHLSGTSSPGLTA